MNHSTTNLTSANAGDARSETEQYILEIYRDHRNLSPAARHFAETTARGRAELRLAESIAAGVANLPRVGVPAILRTMIFSRLSRPMYTAWQLALVCLLAALSPILFHRLTLDLGVNAYWLPVVFLCFGLLNVLLILPLAFYIFQTRRHEMENLERSVDDALDHPMDNVSRLIARLRNSG